MSHPIVDTDKIAVLRHPQRVWAVASVHGEARRLAVLHRDLARKYASRLLLFQAGPLFSLVAVLFLFVFLRIKLRNRRKLERMERIDRGLAPEEYSD